MRAAFYTETPEWKAQVVSQARQALFQALDGLAHHPLDRLDAAQVGLDVDEAAAQRAHLGRGLLGRNDAGAGDVGPGGGQGQRDALAQTGIGTGYQRDLAFEAEWIGHDVPCFSSLTSRTSVGWVPLTGTGWDDDAAPTPPAASGCWGAPGCWLGSTSALRQSRVPAPALVRAAASWAASRSWSFEVVWAT